MSDEELRRFAPDWADLDVLRAVYAAGVAAGREEAARVCEGLQCGRKQCRAEYCIACGGCAEAIRAEGGATCK